MRRTPGSAPDDAPSKPAGPATADAACSWFRVPETLSAPNAATMATVVDCAEFGTLTLDAPSDDLALFGRAGLRSVMSATGVAAHRLSRSGADPDDQANNETATITAGRRAVIKGDLGVVGRACTLERFRMRSTRLHIYASQPWAENARFCRGQCRGVRLVRTLPARTGHVGSMKPRPRRQ